MTIHSAVGKRLGVSDEDITKLISLDKKEFDYKEWLALKYTQDWVFLNGEESTGDYIKDYQKFYSKKERNHILKLLRIMRFTNYLNNTLKKKSWRTDLEGTSVTCSIHNKI
jgi:hypothetical protein